VTQTVIAIVLGAGLFALFGLAVNRECTGHCSGCSGSCGRRQEDRPDV
jgi:hypothetical protein